jgi:hypothetical protein
LQGVVLRGVDVMVHVPRVREQDWHSPVQADSQQNPSTQCLVEHSESVEHRSPWLRSTHVPPLHTGLLPLQPPQHSALAMHVPLHAFSPDGQLVKHAGASLRQPNAQVIELEGVHAPLPLHRAAVFWTPPTQEAASPHDVLSSG